eukprot:TRINITY_DN27336_c0_g1_i1.p1 TRINITY_DN27336_c0_g1~~TRINITY_DN27336_c0_g1_i1.p1  ORF type:complete len:135 (+),score=21.29 TRINITY_DN27336_c0_g1_i1:44-448(+)
MEVKGRTAGQGSDMAKRLGGGSAERFEPYEDTNREDEQSDEGEQPVGVPPPAPPVEQQTGPSKAEQENYAEWVKYYEDVKQYMIRYAAYQAGLRAQRNVEEALALRAAQAAVATAQHISIFETRNPRESKMPKR